MKMNDCTWRFVQLPQVVAQTFLLTWKFNMIAKRETVTVFLSTAFHLIIWLLFFFSSFFFSRKSLQLTGSSLY